MKKRRNKNWRSSDVWNGKENKRKCVKFFFQIVLEELNKRCVFTRTTLFVGLDGIAKISEKNIDEKLLKSVLLHDESFIRNEIEKEISNIRKKVADVQLQLQNCEETAEQLNYELQMCTTRERACELRLKQSLNRREFNRLTLNSNVKELLKQIGKLEFVLQNWAVIKQIKFSISANREFLKCYIVEKSCAVEARNEAERS